MGHFKRELCLLVFLGVHAAAQSRAGGMRLTHAQLRAESGAIVEADTGRIYVPENRAVPSSRTISLHVLRFASRADTNCDRALSTPAAASVAPVTPGGSPKRRSR